MYGKNKSGSAEFLQPGATGLPSREHSQRLALLERSHVSDGEDKRNRSGTRCSSHSLKQAAQKQHGFT